MRLFISILLILIIPLCVCAQNSESRVNQVSGKVVDEDRLPIEYANIILFSAVDSSYIKGTVSDSIGRFEMKINRTKDCFLKISCIGYENFYHDCSNEDIGIIVLNKQSLVLNEVLVKSNLPINRLKNNALVTSIENSVLAKIGTANDVLGKIPGVIDRNGIFDVFGKGTPVIYINGKQVRDNSELDKLSSEKIKNIEVITNPGAQYDASVNAVIRIRTKKIVGDGFGISANAINKISHYYTGNYQVDFNYRRNRLDIFGFLSTKLGKSRYGNTVEQQTTVDTLWLLNTAKNEKDKLQNYAGRLGFNYEINENHSIGAHFQTTYSKEKGSGVNDSEVYSNDIFYDTWNSSSNSEEIIHPSDEANLYYSGSINKLNIDLNLDYLGFPE